MKKIILLFFVFFILLESVLAVKITLSPAHIELVGDAGDEICESVKIDSDQMIIFSVEEKWALRDYEGDFSKYDLDSRDIDFELFYPGEVVSNSGGFDFCVMAEDSGKYYGVLFFRAVSGVGAVGSLIEVEIFDNNEEMIFLGLLGLNSFLLLILFIVLVKRA